MEEIPVLDTFEKKTVLAGCCKHFVEKNVAAALNNEEMAMVNKKIERMVRGLEAEENLKRNKSVDWIEDEVKALERLGSQTFMGENYKFTWEGFHCNKGSSVSSGSSLRSASTVKSAKVGSVNKHGMQ